MIVHLEDMQMSPRNPHVHYVALVPIKINNNNLAAKNAPLVLRTKRLHLPYVLHVLQVRSLLSMVRLRLNAPHAWLALFKYCQVNHHALSVPLVAIKAVLVALIVVHVPLVVMRMALALLNAPTVLVVPIKPLQANLRALLVLRGPSIRPLA